MGLSSEQFARAARAEESQLRVLRLQRMSEREVRALLAGDPAEAAIWVQCAAEFGLAAAQVRFGRMLLEGQGIQRDATLALRWFVRAASNGIRKQ